MKDRICISKKATYAIYFTVLIFLFILLSRLILQSNQASNSKASGTNEIIQTSLPIADPPTIEQQVASNTYKVSLDNSGYIELIGTPPLIETGKAYSIYLKRGESFIHLDTFIATDKTLSQKFSYWEPKVKITQDDVHTGIFYFFQVN
ncbi:MAG: hypothetical protein NTV98_03530 [Candidatus Roizmanbacteria bacterium]|nr:hypothetical protein [Candidatus Roizmanbacteria bacterium]